MDLGEYITLLEKHEPEKEVALGLGNPHPWRGSYDELAFEPVQNTTVGEMLDAAKSAIGQTMTGYKGGDFVMTESTKINIEFYGNWTDGTQALNMLFDLMLGKAA